jgi:hypothetical protein
MSSTVRDDVIRRPCDALSIGSGPVEGQYVIGDIFLYPSIEVAWMPPVLLTAKSRKKFARLQASASNLYDRVPPG